MKFLLLTLLTYCSVLGQVTLNNLAVRTNLTLTASTASRAVVTDGSKRLTTSSATATEVGHLSGVTSGIQTQLNVRVFELDTIVALKAATGVDGSAYMTLGYYSAGDGGGSTYRFSSASALTDDGGGVIAPTAGSGRYLLQDPGWVNVKQFGAKSDGATDSLAFFVKTVAYINSRGGGRMVVPDGNFAFDIVYSGAFNLAKSIQLCSNLTIDMNAGTTLSVLGSWSSGVKYALFLTNAAGLYANQTNIVINGNGATLRGINPNQANDPGVTHGILFLEPVTSNNITLRGLTLTQWGTCAKLNASNLLVDGCTFINANNNCVAITDGSKITISNSRFENCTGPAGGSLVEGGLDIEANSGETVNDIVISSCMFRNNGKHGLYIQQGLGTSSKMVVTGCTFENNLQYGLTAAGTSSSKLQGVVISNNRFSGNGSAGVANNASLLPANLDGATISGNYIVGNTNSYGIRAVSCDNTSFTGNTVCDSGGVSNLAGFYLLVCNNCNVSGNTVNGGGRNGLYLAGGSGLNIVGNTVSKTDEELVYFRSGVHNVFLSGNMFAEPCRVSNGQYAMSSLETSGFISWSNNRFVESIKYNAGIVAAYTNSPTVTIQFAGLASDQNGFYNGYYVLVGASRILITGYVGSTRTATLTSAYGVAPTAGTSTYRIVPIRSVGIVVNSASTTNGPVAFSGNDWRRSGATIPIQAGTGSTLNITWGSFEPVSVSADYTALLSDELILVDATAAARVITLPTTANGRCMNKRYVIKKIDSTGNTVTVDASGSETIDGALTQVISTQWNSVTISGSATDWSVQK